MSVTVRFLAGDSVVLNDCFTVGCVKVRIASTHDRFASDIAVISGAGEPLEDVAAEAPPFVSVVLKAVDVGSLSWPALLDNLRLHAEHDDVATSLRIVAAMKNLESSRENRILDAYSVLKGTNSDEAACKILPTLREVGVPSDNAIHTVARKGFERALGTLLSAGEDVNQVDDSGYSVLTHSSFCGHKGAVEMLLSAAANVNSPDGDESSALFRASAAGHKDVVEVLLAAAANVNAFNFLEQSPLHAASRSGYEGVVEALLSANAKVNCVSHWGEVPLQLASYQGNKGVVEKLLAATANVNCCFGWADEDEAYTSPPDEIHQTVAGMQMALNGRNASDYAYSTALTHAVFSGRKGVVRLLLSAAAIVDVPFRTADTPLAIAQANNDGEMVELLRAGGGASSDANPTGQQCFFLRREKNFFYF